MFLKKAVIWICVAEKDISCSWAIFGSQVIHMKMWIIHSYPHIFQFGSGESKSSKGQNTEDSWCHEAWLTLYIVLSFNNFWQSLCCFCSAFGNAVYLLRKQWLCSIFRWTVITWDVPVLLYWRYVLEYRSQVVSPT